MDSILVARHILNALDQTPNSPAENVVFSSFQLPPRLDDAQKKLIDDWAAKVTFVDGAAQISTATSSLQSIAGRAASRSFSFRLKYLKDILPEGDVDWLVQVFGRNGITTDGVMLSTQGPNASQVLVTVDDTLVGDVVLQALYLGPANEIVMTPPLLVASILPPNASLTGLRVLPVDPLLPVGTELVPELVALYSDGSSSLRHARSDEVTATSSNPSIVSVADPLQWELLSPGTSQVVFGWSGLRFTNQVTAFVSSSALPVLSIGSGGVGIFTLSWPTWASDFVLETTGNLAQANADLRKSGVNRKRQ